MRVCNLNYLRNNGCFCTETVKTHRNHLKNVYRPVNGGNMSVVV